jgi:transketolase
MADSETAEGSVWEAMDLAREHSVSNLRAIINMNRLGQTGPTMLGWNWDAFTSRATAFGWKAAVVDGHDPAGISRGLEELDLAEEPEVLVARTVKGHIRPVSTERHLRDRWVAYPSNLRQASCVIVGSGITFHQALAAADELGNRGVDGGVIDAYSDQPVVDRQAFS